MKARRPWAWPLAPVYRAAIAVKDGLRSAGVLKVQRLKWPVVSVGSISAGGAGKTPVIIALARRMRERGWDVDVLSRGYGRKGRETEWVASLGEGAARRYGDEPVMIARAAEAPVWVGADRYAAGVLAESGARSSKKQIPCGNDNQKSEGEGITELMGARRAHLLDDGFQHRGLARDFDVVLVTAEDLTDALLPAGNRRESLEALRRADAVVVREEELDEVKKQVWKLVREGAQMWVVRRRLVFPAPLRVFGAGLRPVAFCAIARPEGFQRMLLEAGCGVVETVAFEDHHAYEMRDMDRIVKIGRGLGATGFVTTEKDAVKLTKAMCERLETVGAVMTVGLEAEFADDEAVMRAIEAKLEARTA